MRSIFQFLKLYMRYLADGARKRTPVSYSRSAISFWGSSQVCSFKFVAIQPECSLKLGKSYAETIAQAMVVQLHISCDLVHQDRPPALEDIHSGFLGAESGMFSYGTLQAGRRQVFFHE